MKSKPFLSLFFASIFIYISINQSIAHDFWLEAQPFYSKPGEKVDIGIYVGEDLFGEALPNIPESYTDFSYTDLSDSNPENRKKIQGEIARYPAGYFFPKMTGFYTVGYRSGENMISLSGKKFNEYLKTEGLEKIIDYRAKHKLSDKSAKEIYSRCVKTIIQVGDNNKRNAFNIDRSQQAFNYTLEIIPLKNPYQIKLGNEMPIQVNYLGKPAVNILMTAYTKETPWERVSIRTDKQGRANIKLNQKGHWIIRGVEMIQSQRDGVDWESFWASLTFKLK